MDFTAAVGESLVRLKALAPTGFAIGLHIRFHTPRLLFQSYPPAWTDVYSREGLFLVDPSVRWGLGHTGVIDWADLESDDPAGVMARAAKHGIHHGMSVATGPAEDRSIGGFSKGDRPFDAGERADIRTIFEALERVTAEDGPIPPGMQAVLRRLSVSFTHGRPQTTQGD